MNYILKMIHNKKLLFYILRFQDCKLHFKSGVGNTQSIFKNNTIYFKKNVKVNLSIFYFKIAFLKLIFSY